jgi:hypothetical protein
LVRVWRDWLAERAAKGRKGKEREEKGEEEKRLLWSSTDKHVGLRLRVIEREDLDRAPVLISRDEDPNVGYTLQYEGKQSSVFDLVVEVLTWV